MSDFKDYSKEIITNFLQTVVVVDDEAILDVTCKVPTTEEIKKLSIGTGGRITESKESTIPEKEKTDVPEKEKTDAHQLNAKALSDKFAELGLMCTALRPTADEFNSYEKVLKKSDIVILDWKLKHGERNGETIIGLIKKIIQDVDGNTQKSLRNIVIYSGENRLKDKLASVKSSLQGELGEPTSKTDYSLNYEKLQIKIYAKEATQRDPKDTEVLKNEENLVEAIIDDFVDQVAGLVSNTAIESLSQIRKNTHKMLGIFSKELDEAYLSHRALLPYPQDAEELLTTMITDEMQSILDDSKIKLDKDVLLDWLDKKIGGFNQTQLNEKYKKCYLKKSNYESCEEFESTIAFCVNGTFDFQDIYSSDDDDFDDGRVNAIIRQNRDLFLAKLKEDIGHCIMVGIDNSLSKPSSKSVKNKPADFTKLLIDNEKETNDKLSLLSTNKTFYSSPVPYLTLGTILKDSSGKYHISLMPRCDASRIKSPGNTFLILPLSKDNKEYEVVFKDNQVKRCKIDYSPKKLRAIFFKQESRESNVPIYAKKIEEDKYIFIDNEDNKFIWITELKKEKSQNISNKFAAQLSRVGFNESEYLRRSYPIKPCKDESELP